MKGFKQKKFIYMAKCDKIDIISRIHFVQLTLKRAEGLVC
jgi:hypothetical protein